MLRVQYISKRLRLKPNFLLDPNLVCCLLMHRIVNTTTYDISGKANHGTIYGASRTPSKIGQALSFDGINDWVEVAPSATMFPLSALTVMAWVKPNALTGRILINARSASPVHYYHLRIWNSLWYWNVVTSIGAGTVINPATPVPVVGEWAHVAGSWDGAIQRLYINGTLVGSNSKGGTITSSANILEIGNYLLGVSFPFNGIIDEVRIYNKTLSAAEIAKAMNSWGI